MNKSILNAIALATGLLLFAGCKKETVAPPTVKVFDGAITLNCTSAGVSAEVTDQGGAEVKSRGFVYGLSGGSLDTVFCGSGVGVYSAELNNLQPNTTYVYEAFAKNAGGTGSSGKVSFTTKPLPTYTISISADPSDGGVVNGGGSFQESQYCTVIATANDGYTFTNWTEDTDEVSTDANYTFIVNGNRTLKANFRAQLLNEYTISLSANPNNGGSVSGGGTYQEGESCTVSATSNNGYTFTNWTEDGNEISTDANYSFNVNSNRVLVANFTILPPNSYAINVSANPSDGGTVSGGGTYQQGQSCTIIATNNESHTFTNWTENGNVISTNNRYTFTVNANRTLVANFTANAPNQHTISVSANPAEGGTVSGGGIYQQGQTCTVYAHANSSFSFTNWTENGNVVSTNANYSFTVSGNRNLVAHFTAQSPNTYVISVSANPSNGGIVNGGGNYEQGQQCVVEADPNQGFTFIHWMENGNVISTSNRFTFSVSCNRSLVAIFKAVAPNNISANAYPICLEDDNEYSAGFNTGNGEVGPEYGCLNTQPNPAWFFFRMNEPGDMDISIYSSRNPDIDFCCWGPFADPISPCPNGLTENKIVSCSYSSSDIEQCNIPATAQTGEYYIILITNYSNQSCNIHFSKVGGSGTSDCSFIVEPLLPDHYSISVSASPSNGGTVSGGGTYQQGQSCTVSAVANSNYTFTKWTENGNVVSTNANYSFTVNGSRSLVANFTGHSCTINASANPSNGGTVSGAGSYNYGQNCTLTATAATGYAFVKWTKNGTQVSTDASYTFTVTESASYVAHFQIDSYTISVSASPSNGGTVSGGGNYSYGQTCTVHATAASGYSFMNWTNEYGSVVSSNANYSFTVTYNQNLIAHFLIQAQAPTGAINGVFSISSSQFVWFSQGNLQYKASSNTWQFAEHQYDYIGNSNSGISSTYSGWIDLFGWATSGWNCGNTCYMPWESSTTSWDYGPTGDNGYDLTGTYANSDWGVYNRVSNGGNTSHQWRTLSSEEWRYVISFRSTLSGIRYAKAVVNGVNGIILVPDNWNTSYYNLNYTNQSSASYNSNIISASVWANTLETHGAVFLPASGWRSGTTVDAVGSEGFYWSTSHFAQSHAYGWLFSNGDADLEYKARSYGYSVRLVRVIQ